MTALEIYSDTGSSVLENDYDADDEKPALDNDCDADSVDTDDDTPALENEIDGGILALEVSIPALEDGNDKDDDNADMPELENLFIELLKFHIEIISGIMRLWVK